MSDDLIKKAEDICRKLDGFPVRSLDNIKDSEMTFRQLVAEIKRLQAALIDSRAEYLNTIDENPDGTAWTFDEQSAERQAELRHDACQSLAMEEPIILMQLADKDARIKQLEQIAIEAKAEALFLNDSDDNYYRVWADEKVKTIYHTQAAKELVIRVGE
jgi:hypothetical protein